MELIDLRVDTVAPLIVVDIDEVLAMFMRGFETFVGTKGLEMRIDRFALFQNIYRPGESEHLDLAAGRVLFEEFFEHAVGEIDVAPGAVDALARLADRASIVILTNAPAHSRPARVRWLAKHGFPYPMIVNSGLKGSAVAALSRRTAGPAAFVDDLLPNLDSVETEAPSVHRFQMVADERLRPLAYGAPDRHRRIDDWATLGDELAAALRLARR